jgi:hypothetical protein
MLRQTLVLFAALGFLLPFCGFNGRMVEAGDKKAPAPITKPGEYKLYDGKVLIKVTEKKDLGLIEYWIKIISDEKEGTFGIFGGNEDAVMKKQNAVWVIYPESSRKVWVFWRPEKVDPKAQSEFRQHYVEQKDGKWFSTTATPYGTDTAKALAAMPKAMVDALPKKFVESYKSK